MTVLPDVLEYGLKVVFCGAAAGTASAHAGAYYAGPGNAFWSTLFRIGLTPRLLRPEEFSSLPEYGIGLTDVVKERSGADDAMSPADFAVDDFVAKIERFRPRVLAFNGKRAARSFYGHQVPYGRQDAGVGETTVFVLPSTSAAARAYWDEDHWRALAVALGEMR